MLDMAFGPVVETRQRTRFRQPSRVEERRGLGKHRPAQRSGRWEFVLAIALTLLMAPRGSAHIGSPDVFLDGAAGPYRLFVTVRVPQVIPGIAQIEIRSESNDVQEIRIAPMQLTGPGSRYAPTPDIAERSKTDPQFFTGSLWLMEFGSLQVRVDVDGARGTAHLAVPVPAVAQRTLPMQKPLGILLFGLMCLLGFGLVSIASAAVREGDLPPGAEVLPSKLGRSNAAMVVAAIVVACILLVGGEWWRADDSRFSERIYSPPQLQPTLTADGGLLLHQAPVRIAAGNPRRPADLISFKNLILDHDHLMHFFMIRTPQMDSFWHLHPTPDGHGNFSMKLPPVPRGHYQLFADVVLTNGFPVTMVGQIDVPETSGTALTGDDSGIVATSLAPGEKEASTYPLADGGRMIWKRGALPLKAAAPLRFRFEVRNKNGKPAEDLEPYMGMAAHAEIIRSDASVFAHVHPSGSVAMAALELGQTGTSAGAPPDSPGGMTSMPGMNMPSVGMSDARAPIGPDISFPYGFPKPGLYRIFVQVKRAGRIETAVFDASVN